MSKNTLYITFDGLSDSLGQSQILPYLTGIAENGYNITILSCEKTERLKTEQNKIEELLKKNRIEWKHIPYDEQGGFTSRMKYLAQLSEIAEKEHAQKKFQLVHCRSYLSSWIGLKLKRKYNIPFIFDMRGFWANERVEGNIWSRKNPIHLLAYRYFKFKEKQFLKHSSAIVSLTHAAAGFLDKTYPRYEIGKKTEVIPCCVNTTLFDPSFYQKEKSERDKDHLLVYTGSIGTWYYTREMIDCVLVMKKTIPDVKLLIVTRDLDALDKVLENYSDKEKEIIQRESASYSMIPSLLSRAKASIFFIKPSFSKMASSPTKMAECWAMDLPIITNPGIGDNDLYFKDNRGGLLIDAFTPEAYEKAAREYLRIIEKHGSYRDIAVNHFNTKTAVAKYSAIYNSLTVDAN
ncbi:MAG: glycosyltransferase [Bacteroidetes bacterium]|nr:glycosyltransferase [Bacteroidota bacterium]